MVRARITHYQIANVIMKMQIFSIDRRVEYFFVTDIFKQFIEKMNICTFQTGNSVKMFVSRECSLLYKSFIVYEYM